MARNACGRLGTTFPAGAASPPRPPPLSTVPFPRSPTIRICAGGHSTASCLSLRMTYEFLAGLMISSISCPQCLDLPSTGYSWGRLARTRHCTLTRCSRTRGSLKCDLQARSVPRCSYILADPWPKIVHHFPASRPSFSFGFQRVPDLHSPSSFANQRSCRLISPHQTRQLCEFSVARHGTLPVAVRGNRPAHTLWPPVLSYSSLLLTDHAARSSAAPRRHSVCSALLASQVIPPATIRNRRPSLA